MASIAINGELGTASSPQASVLEAGVWQVLVLRSVETTRAVRIGAGGGRESWRGRN